MEAGAGAQDRVTILEGRVAEARRKLAAAERELAAWQAGAEGERRTGAVLSTLPTDSWVVLHDLHWPGRPFANIDHIAIGPTGVFVIDSKNWSGHVEVRDAVLRQNGYRRSDACEGVASATAGVAAFLEPQHRGSARAVICLVDQATPATQPLQTAVVGLTGLLEALQGGPVRIAPVDVQRIGAYLRQLLNGPRSPEQRTTAALLAAGAAPVEPPRGRRTPPSRPVHPVPQRTPGPRRKRGSARRRTGKGAYVLRQILMVVAVAVLTLLMWPRFMHGLGDAVTHPTPVTTPSPAAGFAPHATKGPTSRKAKTPRPTQSSHK